MNYLKSFYAVMLILISLCSACENAPEVSPSACLEGTFLAADCPGLVFIQVNNANIGAEWTLKHSYGIYETKTYSNAITINNIHQFPAIGDLKVGDKIYFTINEEASKNPFSCVTQTMVCTADVRFETYPSKSYCINFISKQACATGQE
jgi:hypothetical protein